MPSFVVFILVLGGIWTLSGISTWLNKQKEAERRQRLREQMARAGVNVPIAAPIVSQSPRQISDAISQRFPDVLLPPSLQRPTPPRRMPQKLPPQARPQQQRTPQQRPQQRPMRLPALPQGARRQPAKRPPPQTIAQQLTGTLAANPPMAMQRPASAAVAPSLQSPSRPTTAPPRMTAASLSRWMNPTTMNQQFLLSEIFQPPVGLRDPSLGL